jgi:hypothetical protein
MLVLDALFDHIQQISSNVEIIGSIPPPMMVPPNALTTAHKIVAVPSAIQRLAVARG